MNISDGNKASFLLIGKSCNKSQEHHPISIVSNIGYSLRSKSSKYTRSPPAPCVHSSELIHLHGVVLQALTPNQGHVAINQLGTP